MRASVAAAVILLAANLASAHRLDEYLQATTIAVEKGRVQVEISLAPGVAVFPVVFADLDRDANGVVSAAEQRAYAERVLRDLALHVDGRRLPLRLVSSKFSTMEALQEGRGEIRLDLEADVPPGGPHRRLTFENHHQSRIGAYLVNGLVPRDPDIRVGAQKRNFEQSSYELVYSDGSAPSSVLSFPEGSDLWAWGGSAAIGLIAGLALLGRRGMGVNRPVSEK